MNESPAPPYFFFWLYGWDTEPVRSIRPSPYYTFCRVDKEELYLQDAHVRFCIPISNIKQWKTIRVHEGNWTSANLEITLFAPVQVLPGATTGRRIYLTPMNVFRLNPSWSEIKALAQVLDHVKHGSNINLDPNPYIRNPQLLWRRKPPTADGWNPTTPPYVYTAPLTLSKFLLAIALTVLLCMIIVPPFFYLLYLLLGSR